MILLALIDLNCNKEDRHEVEQPVTDQIQMNFNLKSSNIKRSDYLRQESKQSLTLLPYCLAALLPEFMTECCRILRLRKLLMSGGK